MIEFLGICVLKRKTLNEKLEEAKTEPRKLSNHLVATLLHNNTRKFRPADLARLPKIPKS